MAELNSALRIEIRRLAAHAPPRVIVDHDSGDEDRPDRVRLAPDLRQRLVDAEVGRWVPLSAEERTRRIFERWAPLLVRLAE